MSVGDVPAFPSGHDTLYCMTYRQWLIGMALAGFAHNSDVMRVQRMASLAITSADEVIELLDKEAK